MSTEELYKTVGRLDGTMQQLCEKLDDFISTQREYNKLMASRVDKLERRTDKVYTIAGIIGGVVAIVVGFGKYVLDFILHKII